MLQHLRPALVLILLLSALTGLVYPLLVTAIAQIAMPYQANGSLIERNGVVVGSALIGQWFKSDRYFHPRPSATTDTDPNDSTKTIDAPYNAANSSGSNLGPTSQKLVDRVKGGVEAWRAFAGAGPVPADAVTTSASGLDPDISPQTALGQVAAVAKARGLPADQVRTLVESAIEGRFLGLIGEPRVNVLRLNLALDQLKSS
jgi:potassium-transporting ATPase KdpC subunit